jgi:hypothetical protein
VRNTSNGVSDTGRTSLDEVGAVMLETDGSATVVPRTNLGRESALSGVAPQRHDDERP